MPSVTGITAAKALAIEAQSVIGGHIDGTGHVILETHDGTTIDVGSIITTVPAASTTLSGKVELATDVETQTGSDSVRAVTPFGMASVVASTAGRGLIELATNAETLTGTDAVRAVTPASLASIPGTKVQVVSGISESSSPASYPTGMSLMTVTGSAWSLNSGTGSIITSNPSTDYANQRFYTVNGTGGYPRVWERQYNTAAGGWSSWQEQQILNTLTPASFTQATAFTSYPQGESRLYYTSGTSGSWDFTGKAGEVLTYRDGTDFAKQTWTRHLGGTSADTEVWVRTANATNGWTNWLVVAEDSGWVSIGSVNTGAGYTAGSACQVKRKNGIVYLLGSFTAPSGGYTSTGLLIPTGYRPLVQRSFPVTSNTTTTMSCTVTTAGLIQTWMSAASGASFHISGISYPSN